MPTTVIARSGSDETIQSGISRLDCFAALAMTQAKKQGQETKATEGNGRKKRRQAERRQTQCCMIRTQAAYGARHGQASATGALACRRSITALAAATKRHRSSHARPGTELLRGGRYPHSRPPSSSAGSPQAGLSAGRALARSRPGARMTACPREPFTLHRPASPGRRPSRSVTRKHVTETATTVKLRHCNKDDPKFSWIALMNLPNAPASPARTSCRPHTVFGHSGSSLRRATMWT
jgi:hypothetical protein